MDCPGFGFANAPAHARERWQRMVEDYLGRREVLVMAAVLVDGEIGPTRLDVEVLARLRDREVPLTVIATKHDKVKATRRERRKRDLAEGCGVAPGEVVWVSASKGVGIDRLRSLVRRWLADPGVGGG